MAAHACTTRSSAKHRTRARTAVAVVCACVVLLLSPVRGLSALEQGRGRTTVVPNGNATAPNNDPELTAEVGVWPLTATVTQPATGPSLCARASVNRMVCMHGVNQCIHEARAAH